MGDWTLCPACKFPANGAAFTRMLDINAQCPICNENLSAADIVRLKDPLSLLRPQAEV